MADKMGVGRVHSHVLAISLVLALAVQALGGLLLPWLYRDSVWVVTALRGSDITNLAVVIPLLAGLHVLASRGSLRAQLASAGVFFYVWENNLYYLVGSAFNQFFLVHVAVSILSLAGLALTLVGMDRSQLEKHAVLGMPRKVISLINVAMAAILSILWVGQCVSSLLTGKVPQMILDAGGSTHLIAALDLSILVPLSLLGAVLLWRKNAWGTIISAVSLVQGAIVTIALTITAPVQAAARVPGAWTMVPLWGVMGVVFLVGMALLFGRLARVQPQLA